MKLLSVLLIRAEDEGVREEGNEPKRERGRSVFLSPRANRLTG